MKSSQAAVIRRILSHNTAILRMQLDILWELDTNYFEYTDSDSDIQEGYPLPSPAPLGDKF